MSMQIRVGVKVVGYTRDGKIKKVIEKEGDLVLDNFAYFLRLIFVPIDYGGTYQETELIDVTGTKRTVIAGASAYCWDYCNYSVKEFNVEVGFGTTPPSNSDYTLENPQGRARAEIYSLETLSDRIRIVLRGSVSVASSGTVWEVGLSLRCTDNTGSAKRFLLCRDVLSEGLEVVAGEYVAVYYTIEFIR